MSFSRGRFGVEYHPRPGSETPRLRGLICLVLVLVGVAFIWYKIAHRRTEEETIPQTDIGPSREERQTIPVEAVPRPKAVEAKKPAPPALQTADKPTGKAPPPIVLPPPQPSPTVPPALRPLVARLEATRDRRTGQDQQLIDRYTAAERQELPEIVRDTLAKLYDRPSMADLRDDLLKRLGDINLQMLFSGKPTEWTKMVTVRRGDGRERIAHENRNTPAVVAKLNPLVKWERLRPGNTVRVLRFPKAVLVIHKTIGHADLTLREGEKFFRRYYFKTSPGAACTVYDISQDVKSSVSARFRELGVRADPETRRELEMFLAPGSRITVTE